MVSPDAGSGENEVSRHVFLLLRTTEAGEIRSDRRG